LLVRELLAEAPFSIRNISTMEEGRSRKDTRVTGRRHSMSAFFTHRAANCTPHRLTSR